MTENSIGRLRITCPDRPGIVAAVSTFFFTHGANITAFDQHSTDPEAGTFFTRLEFQTPHLDVSRTVLERSFADVVAARFDMEWDMTYASDLKRMAILVSKEGHALSELLWRFSRGELPCTVSMVISNHPGERADVERFGIPFHHVNGGEKGDMEARILALLDGQADLVVLARYMQILSGDFVARFPSRIINIHHSFLPAFAGASPYRQAYDRGVKRIGATAHYVTETLDDGPIIEQDVVTVSHRHSVTDLQGLGRDIERQVLARAVRYHLEDRIIVHGNKTVVFI